MAVHGRWREELHPRDQVGRFRDLDSKVRVTTLGPDGQPVTSREPLGLDVRGRDAPDPDLPIDALAALHDPRSGFRQADLLDAVQQRRGSPAQRQRMLDALIEHRRRARSLSDAPDIDGMSPDKFRSRILNGDTWWSTTSADRQAEFVEKIRPLIDKNGGSEFDAHRAALAEKFDEAQRERAWQARRVSYDGGPAFADNAQGREWATEHMPSSDLSRGQAQAVRDYTGGMNGPSSTHVNKFLRFGTSDPEWTGRIEANVGELDAAIAGHTLPEPLLLYRGEDEGGLQSLGIDPGDPQSLDTLTGAVISDKAFLSTSIGRRPGGAGTAGGHVVWVLRAPAGTPGLAVNEHSAWQSEGEVLLPRNTKRVIHGAYRSPDPGDARIYVEAEIVADDWSYPDGWQPTPTGDAWQEYHR